MLKQQDTLDAAFKALGDPTRRAIVQRLSRGTASVSELAEPFAMSLPAVHQHLQVLEEAAGLMSWEKRGRVRWCRLEIRALDKTVRWLEERRAMWERRLDALGRHLARHDEGGGGEAA
jgi:DNA-binding transcriptional ArsR family regulator